MGFKNLIIVSVFLILYLNSCSSPPQYGEQLSKVHCAGCHVVPDPKMLDKNTWRDSVFPRMAILTGLRPITDLQSEFDYTELIALQDAHIIPDKPMFSDDTYLKILEYYYQNSPDSLAPSPSVAYKIQTQFVPKSVSTTSIGNYTLIQHDEKTKKTYLGNRQNELIVLNEALKQERKVVLESTPSSVLVQSNNKLLISLMGRMDPTNLPSGMLVQSEPNNTKTLIQGLNRPVAVKTSDINQDGEQDFVVASFGHYIGRLSWFNFKNGKPVEHIIKPIAGALNLIVRDLNADSKPDIMALMAQANEVVSVFYNKGNNKDGIPEFEEKQVLQFPSVYGSSSIDLVDFDADGDDDLIYANGDNGDLSQILKPYHGVRIFLNDGKFNFKERYFFPINGATKALANDFDGDGDTDIAAIAFFADFTKKSQKGFVFLENVGNFKFTPHLEPLSDQNRWLIMEKADYDQDGDQDLLLGSCSGVPLKVPDEVLQVWNKSETKLLLMENRRF